jgi:hypothetical protein
MMGERKGAHPVRGKGHAHYREVDEQSWRAARARATCHIVAMLAHAADTNDTEMVTEAKAALEQLVSA